MVEIAKARVLTTTTPIDKNHFDQEYEAILRSLSNGKTLESLFKERQESLKKKREDEEEKLFLDDIDPDFQNVLSCLKEWGNSYLIEDQIDGIVTIIKYEDPEQELEEEFSGFEREFDQESKRKVSNGSRKENGVSNLSKGVEIESGNVSKSISGNKDGIFSGNNSVSSEYEESYTSSERELDQEPLRKVGSDLSKGIEIESGSGSKSISSNKGGIFGSNSVNDKCEELEQEEEDTCSEKEEPKRLLRSALRKENGVSNQIKGDETKRLNGSKSNLIYKDGIFSGCDKAVNFGKDGTEPEPEYLRFLKHCDFCKDGGLVYKDKGYELAYGRNDEEVNFDGNDSDGSSSDCQLIDSIEFYKNVDVNEDSCMDGKVKGELWRQLIADLKRPYNQEEYDRLWEDISIRKPKLHHKELRKGRELSCVTDTEGKSYLEYHPDLKIKFDESHDDKPKRLILLRGYFFWLKNQVHLGTYKPWKEEECLSITPGSC